MKRTASPLCRILDRAALWGALALWAALPRLTIAQEGDRVAIAGAGGQARALKVGGGGGAASGREPEPTEPNAAAFLERGAPEP